MSDRFDHQLVELTGIVPTRLTDGDMLASLVVAAAGAMGLASASAPLVRSGARGSSVGLVCRDGHIILHTTPDDGFCLVDIVARAPIPPPAGLDVIVRKLGATATRSL